MSSTIAALPFFGGTLSCFDPSDSLAIESTLAGTFDATFSTCALSINGNGVSYATSPLWASAATLWNHAVWLQPHYSFSPPEVDLIDYYNSATLVAKLTIGAGPNSASANYRLYTLQSGVMTLVGSAVSISTAVLQTLDVKLVGNSASGSAAFYVSGTLTAANASGLAHSGWTGVTSIKLWGGFNVATTGYWSQVICDSSSTVGRFVRTDRLNTNSATNTGWTGGVTLINEIPTNDSSFISASSAGLVSTFFETGLSLGTYQILARGIGARARTESGAGPQNVQLAIRSGSSNFFSASVAATAGFQASFNSWTTDPNTSIAWTDAGAAAAESGAKSIA